MDRRIAISRSAQRPAAFRRRGLGCALLLLSSALFAGCAAQDAKLMTDARLNEGYTLILPGVLGRNAWDQDTAEGLVAAEVPTAIEIYDWTQGPHMMPFNVLYETRRRREVAKLADKIVKYQDRYPGRPVNLIGHSGGAAMVVDTLEALPPERRVSVAVLMAAPLSRRYDLRKAQQHTERGVHNFSSPYDVVIGQAFGAIAPIKRLDVPLTAACFGFDVPSDLDEAERKRYEGLLVEHEFSWSMVDEGHIGGHFGWTSEKVVAEEIAPILLPATTPSEPVLTAQR